MLETIPAPAPVAAFRASGTLTGQDYDVLIGELENKLKAHERIAIYAELEGVNGLRWSALTKDLRYSASKLGELHRFAHVAIVSDTAWLRAWAQLAWSLVPRANLRSFSSAEREAALAWAAALEPVEVHRGLRAIPTTRPDTYAFVWNGTITDDDVDAVISKLEAEFESHISVRVLARVEQLGGIRPRALFRSALPRLKALGLRKVERYAVVGGPAWLERYASVIRQLTGIDMRHYPREREAEAWAWLEAAPAKAEALSGDAPM